MNLKETLIIKEACDPAIKWAGNKSLEEAWKECHRGDWMLWWAQEAGADLRLLTLAKSQCAELILDRMENPRSRCAVLTGIAFGRGIASKEDLDEAAAAASDVEVAAYNVYAEAAADYAVYTAAAADGVAPHTDYSVVAEAANTAIDAYFKFAVAAAAYNAAAVEGIAFWVADYVADVVWDDGREELLRKCAEICRQIWPNPAEIKV